MYNNVPYQSVNCPLLFHYLAFVLFIHSSIMYIFKMLAIIYDFDGQAHEPNQNFKINLMFSIQR